MRFAFVVGVCLMSSACGGDGGTDPTTNHQVAGGWSYKTTQLADGHATTCNALSGSAMTVTQQGVRFDGTITGGTISCLTGSVSWTGGFGSGQVTNGRIIGDSVTFDIDDGKWRSWGRFVTADSMAGLLNAIYPGPNGTLIMTGFWNATRTP